MTSAASFSFWPPIPSDRFGQMGRRDYRSAAWHRSSIRSTWLCKCRITGSPRLARLGHRGLRVQTAAPKKPPSLKRSPILLTLLICSSLAELAPDVRRLNSTVSLPTLPAPSRNTRGNHEDLLGWGQEELLAAITRQLCHGDLKAVVIPPENISRRARINYSQRIRDEPIWKEEKRPLESGQQLFAVMLLPVCKVCVCSEKEYSNYLYWFNGRGSHSVK